MLFFNTFPNFINTHKEANDRATAGSPFRIPLKNAQTSEVAINIKYLNNE